MDEAAVRRSLTRITHEIIEKNNGTNDLCLLGIRRRGVSLANALAENLQRFEGVQVPVGSIDISLYRDDLSELGDLPETGSTENALEGGYASAKCIRDFIKVREKNIQKMVDYVIKKRGE